MSSTRSPLASYEISQSHGKLKPTGPAYAIAPYAFATPRLGLDAAVLEALRVLIRNGTYCSILAKWGLQSGTIPAAHVRINGAGS